jgi:hypothetical protein
MHDPDGDFHVVRKRHFVQAKDKPAKLVTTSYQVYCNNVPFLKGAGKALSRREAEWLRDILNKRFKRIGGRNLVKKAPA